MSGILDGKQRIMDSVITLEGRRQMASGKFQVKFASFSDRTTFYQTDVVSGSDDAGARLFLEECHLPQDSITFEADDSGRLLPFPNSTGFGVLAGQIYSGSSSNLTFLTGTDFASLADDLVVSSVDNFKKLYVLGTVDPIFEDDEFLVSDNDVTFTMTDNNPIRDPNLQQVNVNQLESFFQDVRLSNIPNFKYLPPVNKLFDTSADVTDPTVYNQHRLGIYTPLGNTKGLTLEDIQNTFSVAESGGNVREIVFNPTNSANSLAIQIFEIQKNEMLKLDVIDFGKFKTNDPATSDLHVLFAGRVFLDDFGSHTFVRIFTLLLE